MWTALLKSRDLTALPQIKENAACRKTALRMYVMKVRNRGLYNPHARYMLTLLRLGYLEFLRTGGGGQYEFRLVFPLKDDI